jgi:hypothetical protein
LNFLVYQPSLLHSVWVIQLILFLMKKCCLQIITNYIYNINHWFWLAHTTRPDLSTVVSLLAQHQANPSSGNYEAAHYVVKYLVSTKHLGIYFTIQRQSILESFLHFPLRNRVLAMLDVNWCPRDATQTKMNVELPLLVPMSAIFIDLLGPLHWIPRDRALLLEAPLKRKFMPWMSV